LLKLSNIQHLWTPIHAKLKPSIHPLEIVAQLHPTPAVAGVPTEIALAQIRHYETFDRSLYAAPLGWIDCQNNSEFIVGIRSALIKGDRARLYAGAGIVAGSDPEKELAEIQLKFQALLKALT
jgi:menaquinone-specific isochorismate synthase